MPVQLFIFSSVGWLQKWENCLCEAEWIRLNNKCESNLNLVGVSFGTYNESGRAIYLTLMKRGIIYDWIDKMTWLLFAQFVQNCCFPGFFEVGIPNLFGTRDWFRGRQFSHGLGVEVRGNGFGVILLWCIQSRSLTAQFTVGFELLWESNATADLTGGRAQAVM